MGSMQCDVMCCVCVCVCVCVHVQVRVLSLTPTFEPLDQLSRNLVNFKPLEAISSDILIAYNRK